MKLKYVLIVGVGFIIGCERTSHSTLSERSPLMNVVQKPADIAALFPKAVEELKDRVARAQEKALKAIQDILAVPNAERTWENTVKALDDITGKSDFVLMMNITQLLTMVTTDDALRKAAQELVVSMQAFVVENISNNVQLYKALKYYDEHQKQSDELAPDQAYFLKQTLADFKRTGLDLPEEKRAIVIQLQKELAQLSQEFEDNIAADNRTILATKEQLAGLDDDFINSLKKDDDGNYLVGIDYPTYMKVMENCRVADTRKRLSEAMSNHAYPINEPVLKKAIAKRDELAKILGFASYAHLNLDDSMVRSPERAQSFLDELIARSTKKEQQEFEKLVKALPESVTLTTDGKIYPWDSAFVKNEYKKKYLAIDEQEIAEFFPMEKTVEGLLDVYRQFLGLGLVTVPISGLWHPDVTLIAVYSSPDQTELLGYLLLDLYPRDNKFSHACEIGIIPSIKSGTEKDKPGLAVVIANFPKSTAEKPSLLSRHFVNTFFHEFGHALHHLLGRTAIASLSGTSVKRDFVEMPSQMLEEWLWDKDILKKISSHYKTGEPMSADLIDKICALKHFDSGWFVLRQAFLAQISLNYFKDGADKDMKSMWRNLAQSMLKNSVFVETNNSYASFGHLMGYGPSYYGYMWSKVFAQDLFNEILMHGLLNAQIGKKYICAILAPGGTKDPNELLRDFLGREPNQEAFFRDLGI